MNRIDNIIYFNIKIPEGQLRVPLPPGATLLGG